MNTRLEHAIETLALATLPFVLAIVCFLPPPPDTSRRSRLGRLLRPGWLTA